MAGPAIRAWQIADALAPEHDVRLVSTAGGALDRRPGSPSSTSTSAGCRDAHEWCEVLVGQGWVLAGRPCLAEGDAVVVADVYDPMHLEQLEQGHDDGHRRRAARGRQRHRGRAQRAAAARPTSSLCASEKQRDFWLGQLAALGRVNPATYDADPTLRSLIDVVPFGLDGRGADSAPAPGLRGVVPASAAGTRSCCGAAASTTGSTRSR